MNASMTLSKPKLTLTGVSARRRSRSVGALFQCNGLPVGVEVHDSPQNPLALSMLVTLSEMAVLSELSETPG